MNQIESNIYPPFKKYLVGNKIKIRPLEITLFESIRILVQIYNDSTNDLIDTKLYLITGDEYAAWSNDDKYLVDLVKQKLSQEGNNN
jgi:hypothetical protein